MALTLTEGNKYSRTELQKAIIDRLAKDDPILERLPFTQITGNSLTYDTWTTRAGATFYSVNETWVESTPVITQETAVLRILGGDADVDNFIAATRSNIMDVQAEITSQKTLSVREKFLDTFYYGDNSTNTKEFSGLHKLISNTTYNTLENASGGTSQTGSVKELRQTIDLVTGHSPSVIVMSKKVRRDLSAYFDSIGEHFTRTVEMFGKHVEIFDGIPIVVTDHIGDAELYSGTSYSASSGGDGSTVFVLTFAPTACCGLQGPSGVEVKNLGDLETKDATRVRIRWYCGLMFQDLRSCAKYSGVITGTTWGA